MSNADDPDVGDLLPGESGSAVLICNRSDRGSALTFWPSLDQAVEAAADLATPSCALIVSAYMRSRTATVGASG